MDEYKRLYDALITIQDVIQIHATLMQAEVLHGRLIDHPSLIHEDAEHSGLPIGVHIGVHQKGLEAIAHLSKPEVATNDEKVELFVHLLIGALSHWGELPIGDSIASEIARNGLAKNPSIVN